MTSIRIIKNSLKEYCRFKKCHLYLNAITVEKPTPQKAT